MHLCFFYSKSLFAEKCHELCNRLRTGTPMITWFMYTDFRLLTYRIFEDFPIEILRNFQGIFQENFEVIDPEISRKFRVEFSENFEAKFRGIFRQNFQRISRIIFPKFRGFFIRNFEAKKSKILRKICREFNYDNCK